MSNVNYGNKSIEELDSYYGIGEKSDWKRNECAIIQKAFKMNNINLTLMECKDLYEWYSDKYYCARWEGSILIMMKIMKKFSISFIQF
ncbi:hypothetical protein [Clostridium massiliamazoniense]|uniref:hypothetical protein n=1 Tax=Clostridium massiliamazoniense TaxID=1347366 RepID=UPI0006D7AA11|nr:hypothetical protein [Clostridium massiliamazoniense]